jgi:hypothetical protein
MAQWALVQPKINFQNVANLQSSIEVVLFTTHSPRFCTDSPRKKPRSARTISQKPLQNREPTTQEKNHRRAKI